MEEPTTGAKVLVVDDDPSFCSVCRIVLTKGGYRVVTAPDGTEGLARARQERPDLIVLDFMMATPMEGQSAAWDFREEPELQDVPILMVTAVGSRHPWWRIQPGEEELPVDGWLDKPVAPERLLAEVGRLLEEGCRTPG